ncbi:MAG: phosphotransferase [Erysipelotrichaceae bacterium]|nr:phosphotransferase [Erysipelotrichaceae bacterium]
MRHTCEDNILTIYLEGNFDTNNSDQIGAQMQELKDQYPDAKLVIDAEDLVYISSAGLRQILKMKKKVKDLKIINCSSEVYEVFSMTGFSEMMDIEKGYRHVSVEGCEKIGEGSNGIVYRINPDTIVKVYKNSDALDDIKRERELARTALVMGINTAIPFDVVKVGDKYGSIFELLSAKSITRLVKDNPDDKDKYIRIFADMLKEIHATPVKEGVLPNARATVIGWAKWLESHLPEESFRKLVALTEGIPEHHFVLHGDYHTNNVHYADNEAILIDMDTLSEGYPIIEFASVFMAYRGYGELDHDKVEKFLEIEWDLAGYILEKLMEFYFDGKDKDFIDSVMDKARVIGYTRGLRRTIKRESDNVELIDHYKKQLIELIDKVDTLLY